jgi:protocatechuate 3,4-dioxygenase beta subunit
MDRCILAVVIIAAATLSTPVGAQRQGGPDRDGGQPAGRQGGPAPFGRGFVRDPVTGTATIRGRVVAADTGAAVRRAQVRAQGVGPARLATSDANGNFELRDLPAGRWTLTASKAGFVTQRLGQTHPYESVAPIEIADGQRFDRANFALPRGAAITGHVFDEYGDPIAGARVQVWRYQMVRGRRQLAGTGGVDQTDDTGAFRVYGLSPGDYYVSANLRGGVVDTANDATIYAPTYFPGTGDVADAQRITLTAGEEQGSVSFALLPVRSVRVSGTVLDSSGMPLGSAMLTLATDSGAVDAPAMTSFARVRGDGGFMMTNVTPGSYTLIVTSAPRRNGNSEMEVASIPLVVGQDDVSGVTVTTTKGATIDGTVVAERNSGTLQPKGIVVQAQPLRPGPGFNGRLSQVSDAGAFSLSGLVGPEIIRVDRLPQDWMVQSIEIGGVDVTDTPLAFRGTERNTDARITLTSRITEVSGMVRAREIPASGLNVVIFPEDPAKWAFPSRYLRTTRTDAQGAFTLRALPPHDHYLALAVDYLEEGEASDPTFLERMKPSATAFALRLGDSKAVTLELVGRQN